MIGLFALGLLFTLYDFLIFFKSNSNSYTELNRTIRIFGSIGVYISLLIISFIIIFVLEDFNRENRRVR